MKIAFIWQGLNGRYGYWKDGLYAAMKLIEQEHEVRYFDFPLDGIHDFKPDVVLYWEAPCTLKGQYADNYKAVLDLPYKKALLFAGGPIEPLTCYGFDMFFVESKINEDEFEALGLPWKRAFGVNTQIMRPMKLEKKWDGFMQATFADWKRHTLFAEALKDKGCVAGRKQEHDLNGYNRCVELGVNIFPEQTPETIAILINQSHAVVNTASYWGGGQRCTLEAMACDVPVIVMKDSVKNSEHVLDAFMEGFLTAGIISPPEVYGIQEAITHAKSIYRPGDGLKYVQSKWTERHYANALLEGIKEIV